MNKKGSSMLLGIVTAVMLFMAGMLIMNFIKTPIDEARIALGCNDLTISDGSKLTCLGTDLTIPYLIWAVVSTAGGIIVSRLTL